MFSKSFIPFLFISSALLGQDNGMNHYENQEFEAAQQYYESVLMERGNNPEAHFGRGASSFQRGDLETAKQSFEQSLKSEDASLQAKAMYNLGNTFYQNQKTEEALAFYRKALELDPTDKEAKYNYEYLKYQQEPPKDENQEQDQNQDQENKDQEEQEQDKQDQDKQEKEEEEQENQEEKDEKQEEQNQDQQQQQEQQEASEEEKAQDLKQAESILDALKQDEKIMQKQQIARAKSRKLAKDW
ncbi:MAG: tetratricopeptide repeat protein [Candidatus Marinimicrobia bacterium]|nr:tetratricopeptide repeat protein [Candidatus Neomarinimicrobiota bacterium]MDD9931882.1 tetratricopeptide repeat protein [Candidatus Neomarinimicrobiota bacterium]